MAFLIPIKLQNFALKKNADGLQAGSPWVLGIGSDLRSGFLVCFLLRSNLAPLGPRFYYYDNATRAN